MPAMAWAALPSTTRLIRLSPDTSVTEYIMAMSLAPTNGLTSPAASVETISLGTPTGSARMPLVTMEVPPPPPRPMIPAMSICAAI